MQIEQEIELSLTENLVPPVVHIKQFDHMGRKIKCSIYQDSILYSIPDGVTANVTGTKPDGNVFQYSTETDSDVVTVEDTTVSIAVTDVMSSVIGSVPVDVTLIDSDGSAVGNFAFLLRVEKAALNSKRYTRASYIGALHAVAENLGTVSINEDGYLVIESDDGMGISYEMNDEGYITIEYNKEELDE